VTAFDIFKIAARAAEKQKEEAPGGVADP